MSKREVIYGLHAVKAVLVHQPQSVITVQYDPKRSDKRLSEVLELAKTHRVALIETSRNKLDSRLGISTHQSIMAEVKSMPQYLESDLEKLQESQQGGALFLALDGVQDPHNLGAIIRTAEALGVHALILPSNRQVPITPTVRKIASGADQILPIVTCKNLVRTLESLKEKGMWLVGTSGEAQQSLHDLDLKGDVILCMGAEGSGIRKLTESSCDYLAKIPLNGVTESLNVSVAAGIALYEVIRQRSV